MDETAASLQVLVVDDDDGIRGCLCELLATEQYEPIGCKSAEAAWARLRSGLRPSVMLVDLALQRMSGRELLGLLRATEWGQLIPVVLFSGWHRAERFADQADVVLSKGTEATSIMRTIDRLARQGRRRPPRRAEAREQGQPAPALVAVAH
jgi:two-component system response regulator MprA